MFMIAQARGWCLESAGAVGLLEVSGLTLHGVPTTGWADIFLDGSGFPSLRAEAARRFRLRLRTGTASVLPHRGQSESQASPGAWWQETDYTRCEPACRP